jgi:asparagine synthetase A
MDIDCSVIPDFYREWTRNALARHKHDSELIKDLTLMRDDHEWMAKRHDEAIDRFDRDGLREGREEVLADLKSSRDHCHRVVATVDAALKRMTTFT